jgi:FAD/FMN-containing dehydrogenase
MELRDTLTRLLKGEVISDAETLRSYRRDTSIFERTPALVAKYHGSTTGEHNGIIRTPYLRMMYGDEVYRLFEKVRHIFGPLGIFNPGKKSVVR